MMTAKNKRKKEVAVPLADCHPEPVEGARRSGEPLHRSSGDLIEVRLGRTLRAWRKQRGLKISCAASELGVSVSTWGHWETGAKFPGPKRLNLLAAYLGIPVCQLFRGTKAECQDCAEQTPANR